MVGRTTSGVQESRTIKTKYGNNHRCYRLRKNVSDTNERHIERTFHTETEGELTVVVFATQLFAKYWKLTEAVRKRRCILLRLFKPHKHMQHNVTLRTHIHTYPYVHRMLAKKRDRLFFQVWNIAALIGNLTVLFYYFCAYRITRKLCLSLTELSYREVQK